MTLVLFVIGVALIGAALVFALIGMALGLPGLERLGAYMVALGLAILLLLWMAWMTSFAIERWPA